ncbi:MAG: oligosaccharide flippase family protein [Bacteroidota bacterium]
MSRVRLLVKNFILLFTSNVTGQLFFMGGLIHLARTLGPGGFGLWNFAQSWLMYLFRGGEMGLEVIGVREIARSHKDTPRWITAVVLSRCALAIVLLVCTILAAKVGLIPQDASPLVITFALLVIPMAFILEWVFEGHQDLFQVSVARVAKGLIFLVLVVIFVRSTSDMNLSAFFYVISLTFPIIYVGIIAYRRFGSSGVREAHPIFPYLWKSAFPVGVATLLSQYSLFLGTMVIGYTMQRDQLGYFTASHRIMIFLWAYIISSLQRIILPTLSNLHKISSESYQSFVERFMRFAALVSFGLGLFVTALAALIIRLLYSESYDPSIPVLKVLVWAFVMASIRTILEISLLASDRQKMYLKGMLGVAFLYTVLTPWMVSLYGIIGAAYAAIIVESLYFVFLLALWSYERHSDIWKTVVKSFFAVTIAVVAMVVTQLNIFLGIVLAMSLYVGLLIVTKAFYLTEFVEFPKLVRVVLGKEK